MTDQMPVQVVLITGANSGIGRAAVQALWQSPAAAYHILATGRSLARLHQAADLIAQQCAPGHDATEIECLELDISSDASIASAVTRVRQRCNRLDALVNNAGGSFDGALADGSLTEREAWSRTMDLGAVSQQLVTSAFSELLVRSASPRLLFVTSGMASLREEHERRTTGEARQPVYEAGWPKPERLRSGNAYAYRVSKTALNMVALLWSRILEPDGVKCFLLSPGFLATNLSGDQAAMQRAGAEDPILGGEFIAAVLEGKRDDDVGRIIRRDGVQPW